MSFNLAFNHYKFYGRVLLPKYLSTLHNWCTFIWNIPQKSWFTVIIHLVSRQIQRKIWLLSLYKVMIPGLYQRHLRFEMYKCKNSNCTHFFLNLFTGDLEKRCKSNVNNFLSNTALENNHTSVSWNLYQAAAAGNILKYFPIITFLISLSSNIQNI